MREVGELASLRQENEKKIIREEMSSWQTP